MQYNGVCTLRGEAFVESFIIANDFLQMGLFNASNSIVSIPMHAFTTDENEPKFVRFVARSATDVICSDANSQQTFYRFMSEGMVQFKLYYQYCSLFISPLNFLSRYYRASLTNSRQFLFICSFHRNQ